MSPEVQKTNGYPQETESKPLINDASLLWSETILKTNPHIKAITLAYYSVPGRQDKVKKVNTQRLIRAKDPAQRLRLFSAKMGLDYNCAISSIVETDNDAIDTPLIKPQQHKKLAIHHPMAIPQMDLTIPVSNHNTQLAIDILDNFSTDWFLLNSGNSYHAILNTTCTLTQLPLYWSQAVSFFSQAAHEPFVKKRGQELAGALAQNASSKAGLKLACDQLFRETFALINHMYGSFDNFTKLSLLDWGHIGYSVTNLFGFYEGVSAGTGYLRIGPKKEMGSPQLIAQRVEGKVSLLTNTTTQYAF